MQPGVYILPAELDQESACLKLLAMDMWIDTLAPAQQHYLNSSQFYPFSLGVV